MKVVLGIDPGTVHLGYALVNEKLILLQSGVIHLNKYSDIYERLGIIFKKIDNLIKQYLPQEMAIEAPFFGKNVQSMLKLGRAQGVAIAAAIKNDLKVFEYSPTKIKLAVTGNGVASKEQVFSMLKNIFNIKKEIKFLDETDAIAVAYCHLSQKNFTAQKKYKDWADFVQKNSKNAKFY